jgi:hypothetical protein
MEPQPTLDVIDDRLVRGQFFGCAVRMKTKGPYQARQDLTARLPFCARETGARLLGSHHLSSKRPTIAGRIRLLRWSAQPGASKVLRNEA